MGTVYLLHFERPYRHARHYTGWSASLAWRLAHHRAGTGARLCAVVAASGGRWVLARTWEGDRTLERRLKDGRNIPKLCPICRGVRLACFDCGKTYRYAGWLRRHREACHPQQAA